MELHLTRSIDYLLTKKEVWDIICEANINGLVIKKAVTYNWIPPINNLAIGEEMKNNTPYTYLSFKNNYNSNLDMEIIKQIEFNGSKSYGYENLTVTPGQTAKVYLFQLQPGTYHVEITMVVKNMNLKKTIAYDLEV